MSKSIQLSGKLGKGKFTLVDDDDYENLIKRTWHWSHGYAVYTVVGKKIFMHRVVMNTPSGFHTDHINGDQLDNRKCNLRHVTSQQNHMNQRKQKGCSSKYKGVCFRKSKSNNQWEAHIKLDRKYIYIGYYATEDEAAKAYDKMALKIFGEYAKLNFAPALYLN